MGCVMAGLVAGCGGGVCAGDGGCGEHGRQDEKQACSAGQGY